MLWLLQCLFVIIIFISTCFLVYFSILSRRKQIETSLQFAYRARMNISMGICFLAWAGLQFTLPSAYVIRTILIVGILIIGLINLYYGIKRYRWLKKRSPQNS